MATKLSENIVNMRPSASIDNPLFGQRYQIYKTGHGTQQSHFHIGVKSKHGADRNGSAPRKRTCAVLSPEQYRYIKDKTSEIEEQRLKEEQQKIKKREERLRTERDRMRKKYTEKETHFTNLLRLDENTNRETAKSPIMKEVENMEETKAFLRLVSGVKCQAIREAQIEEKEQIKYNSHR